MMTTKIKAKIWAFVLFSTKLYPSFVHNPAYYQRRDYLIWCLQYSHLTLALVAISI